ncbi:hypothetical protein Pla175_03510 [Pirellulimonas nuda]|uniref:Uncharacterized protein n=1 Tax=Pirellulimonas nuda TaxID=2528009 RepID=A0A518D6A1_9BACT|nr:hypothetical protein [Pirellulimonas nuda]QDU86997.1 hypothetical protein Pla175_03510 [Pirellulimonas nuda]
MAARKKQALSQKLVGVATTGMPSPVRRVLQMRLVAMLVVLAFPVLLWTGIVTIDTSRGYPRFSINREKAVAAEQALAAEVQQYRGQQAPADGRFAPFAGPAPAQEQRFAPFASVEQAAQRRFAPFAGGQQAEPNQGWPKASGFLPHFGGQPEAPQSPQGAFSGWGGNAAPSNAPNNGWGAAPQQQPPQQATNAWGQSPNAW